MYSNNTYGFFCSQVIIIVVIVVLALVVIFFIACNRFIGMVKKPTEGEEDRGLRMPLGASTTTEPPSRAFVGTEFSDSGLSRADVHRLPSMPPSYDEVVKNSGMPSRASRSVFYPLLTSNGRLGGWYSN